MATSFYAAIIPSQMWRTPQSLQVKAQCFRDEGRRNNIVDANLSILREKIEQLRTKERLERCCRTEHGWNYAPVSDYRYKKEVVFSQAFELVGMVGGTVGLTLLSD
ncbi:unnamed protein product [Ilex paraguariensis]|uniref:Uncharacterized protein n=1 Tax=Ilex paraguariensis TaxID=185542 RepID=A0ABC8S0C1_9AQUA